jgi:hypothetical protein
MAGDTNSVEMAYVRESTWKVPPSNPVFQKLRITGLPDSGMGPQSRDSQEIRADRQLANIILVGNEPGGTIPTELSFDTLDDLIEGVMMSTWENYPEIVNTASDTEITGVVASSEQFTFLTGAGSATFLVDSLFIASGFTDAEGEINGLHHVVAKDASSLTVQTNFTEDETAPPAGARIKMIGIAFNVGDCAITGSFTLVNSLTTLTDFNLDPGDWVKLGGPLAVNQFATATNNVWCRVATVTATTITFDIVMNAAGVLETDTGEDKDIQLFIGDKIINGTTQQPFTFEMKSQTYSGYAYRRFHGALIDRMRFNIRNSEIVGVDVTFVAGQFPTVAAAILSGATYLNQNDNDIMAASSDLGSIGRGSTEITDFDYVTEVNIEIMNNVVRKPAAFNFDSIGMRLGEFSIGGTIRTYYESIAQENIMRADQSTNYNVYFVDEGSSVDGLHNRHLLIDLPQVKYSDGRAEASGKNDDVTIPLSIRGFRNPTLGYTMKIQRFHYVPA